MPSMTTEEPLCLHATPFARPSATILRASRLSACWLGGKSSFRCRPFQVLLLASLCTLLKISPFCVAVFSFTRVLLGLPVGCLAPSHHDDRGADSVFELRMGTAIEPVPELDRSVVVAVQGRA